MYLGAFYTLQFALACPRNCSETEALLFSSTLAFDLVVLALDTMKLKRPPKCMPLVGEISLVATLSSFTVTLPASERISKAWDLVRRCSVVEERNLLSHSSQMFDGALANEIKSVIKAAHDRVNERGLRTCALESCNAHEVHTGHFKCCGACKLVAYCCREHQVEAWPDHKPACKAAGAGKGRGVRAAT